MLLRGTVGARCGKFVQMSHESERAAIVEVCRRLYEKGLVTANEGNISVRVRDGHLVTASGLSKGSLTVEQVLFVHDSGRKPAEGPAVSSEDEMHAAIYRTREDVMAIIHAHPPTATAFAVAHIPIDTRILAESVVVLGVVPLVPYTTPGTSELAELVARNLKDGHAALLANHGAVALGATLAQAHQRMETLEQVARVAFMARLLGGAKELSNDDVERLLGLEAARPR